jgi:hypothetical protein
MRTYGKHSPPSEVVGRALARKRLVAEVFKVGTCFGGRSVEYLAAFVDDHDLVEEVVDTFTSLVPGNNVVRNTLKVRSKNAYRDTNVVCPKTSVITLKLFAKSRAVDASRPRVELSQHCTRARVAIISAILTRLRSPPETPRTNSLPTRVCFVCEMFSIRSRVSCT